MHSERRQLEADHVQLCRPRSRDLPCADKELWASGTGTPWPLHLPLPIALSLLTQTPGFQMLPKFSFCFTQCSFGGEGVTFKSQETVYIKKQNKTGDPELWLILKKTQKIWWCWQCVLWWQEPECATVKNTWFALCGGPCYFWHFLNPENQMVFLCPLYSVRLLFLVGTFISADDLNRGWDFWFTKNLSAYLLELFSSYIT